MSTTEGGGNVVQDGLYYYLDASNPKSFTGGTYIKDLSRFQQSGGTLIGGALYSSSNKGCITFDGVDEYIALTQINTPQTVDKYSFSVWFSPSIDINSSITSNYMIVEAQNTLGGGPFRTDNYLYFDSTQLGRLSFQIVDNSRTITTTTNDWKAGNWYNIMCTYDISTSVLSLYVNGVIQNTSTRTPCYFNTNSFFNLGAYSSPTKQWFFPGRLGSFMLYTKTLTAAEVLQNYNAAKYKYI